MNSKNYELHVNFFFFKIDNFITKYNQETKKDQKSYQRIDLKPINWNEYKETFFNQRFDTYKDKGFTKNQIINFEITKVERLPNENEKYIALKENYTQLLNEKLKNKEDNPEQTKKQINFEDFFFNVKPQQLKQIKEKFKDLEPKETAIFIDLLYNDFNVLNITYGSRKGKSQKDFIRHITNYRNQSINKLFLKDTIKNYIYKGNEADKTTIKTQLETILK